MPIFNVNAVQDDIYSKTIQFWLHSPVYKYWISLFAIFASMGTGPGAKLVTSREITFLWKIEFLIDCGFLDISILCKIIWKGRLHNNIREGHTVLGSTKDNKVESLIFKNILKWILFYLWNSKINFIILNFLMKFDCQVTIHRSWPISGGQIITLFFLFFFSSWTCF